MSLILPAEIDFELIINEVWTEVAADDQWQGDTAHLEQQAIKSGTDLVYVTDCEGEFVCIATRRMAEWITKTLNELNP